MKETNPELLSTLVNPVTQITTHNQQQTLKIPTYIGNKTSASTKSSTLIAGIFIAAAPFLVGVISGGLVSVLAPSLVSSLIGVIPYLGLSLSLMTLVIVAVWFRRSSDKVVYSTAAVMSLMIGLFCGLAFLY